MRLGLGISIHVTGSVFEFDQPSPRTLYHNGIDTDLSSLYGWYDDAAFTTPASSLPTSIDYCIMASGGSYGSYLAVTGILTCETLDIFTSFALDSSASINAVTVNVHGMYSTFYATGSMGVINAVDEGVLINSVDGNSTVNLNGYASSFGGEALYCYMNGADCYYSGATSQVYVNGTGAYISGIVNGNVESAGHGTVFQGSCYTLYLSGEASRADYGCFTTGTYLMGEWCYAEYGSNCYGNMYLTGANCYLASGANIFGDVYYDSSLADPSLSGAYITGNIYVITP
jgi:hypothetical protein